KIGPALHAGGQLIHVAFCDLGKSVLTSSEANTARLWDATTGESRGLTPPLPPEVQFVAFASRRDGKIILVGTEGNAGSNVRFWDPATGRPFGPLLTHQAHIPPPVFSPDGRIILTPSDDGTARLWDADSGDPIGVPLKAPGGFNSAAFSSD